MRQDDEPRRRSPDKEPAKVRTPSGDDYSSDRSSEDDNRFMDINDLKNRQKKQSDESPGKSSQRNQKAADDEDYEDDDFI